MTTFDGAETSRSSIWARSSAGKLMRVILCIALPLCYITSVTAQDSDVHDLQENLPVRVTDAIASKGPQLQGRTLVSWNRAGGKQVQFEPQLQWGFAPGWHVQTAGVMLASSREESTNSGDVQVLVFRQINQIGGRRPMVAVSAGIDLPSGIESAGLDTRLRGIVTQRLGGRAQHRVHGNLEWLRNAAKRQDERTNAWLATVGYSRLLGRELVLIVDAARIQERSIDEIVNVAEGGMRGRISKQLVVSAGVGVGFGPTSPKITVTFGVEQSF